FDEPTTGLHLADIETLLGCFARLVARGHSLIVIEHHLEVVKCADWVIDLGPEGGEAGGRLVAAGPPETIARAPESHTGRFLAEALRGPAQIADAPPAYASAVAANGNIRLVGAREHNLRDLSLELPRDRLIVLTGLSGSGKSSLAFDVLHAEGQRRYVDSLSAYARQLLNVMAKPDLDPLTGLPPPVAIAPRLPRRRRTSPVAPVTEVPRHPAPRAERARRGRRARAPARARRAHRARRRDGAALLRAALLPRLQPRLRGPRPAPLLVQQPPGRLPGLRRRGRDRRPRPRGDPRSGALARGRRAGPVRRGGAAPCEAAPAARARRGRRAARPAGRAPGRASPPPGPGGLRRAAGRAHRP